MDAKVDYISFTVDFPEKLHVAATDERLIAEAFFEQVFSGRVLTLVITNDWQVYNGGKFYQTRIMDVNTKISLSFSKLKPYATVELSGQTCEIISNAGLLNEILEVCKERITRIDLAVDFETDCTPGDFLSNGYSPAFKGRSTINEVTGITDYVGSWNSERFARVYRYHDPHPRSKLLRVEHVLKGNWAKSVAPELLKRGLAATVEAVGNAFAWQNPLWQPTTLTIGKIKSPRSTPTQAGKYRWLVTQVAPAIRKAMDEGWFDFPQWVNEHIYNDK